MKNHTLKVGTEVSYKGRQRIVSSVHSLDNTFRLKSDDVFEKYYYNGSIGCFRVRDLDDYNSHMIPSTQLIQIPTGIENGVIINTTEAMNYINHLQDQIILLTSNSL